MKRRRRLASLVLGAGLGLAALELVLQAGAFVIWSRRQHDAPAAAGAILCAGDSFTYGLGATGDGGSYPRQLEALLRAHGLPATVVNGGWPGRDSRAVLLRLPEQLARHRPARVCILVGVNDPWSRPEPVREDELQVAPAQGFPLRPRLLQVFTMLAAALRGGGQDPHAFVGTWHSDQLEVVFEPGGRVVLGKDELRWLEEDGRLALLMPGGAVEPMQWEIRDRRLHLRTPSLTHTLEAGPVPAPSALARARKALAAGDAAGAKVLLQQALADPNDAAAAREHLVRLAVAAGDGPARERLLDELRAAFAAHGGVAEGEALAHALAAAGHLPEALDTSERVLAEHPGSLRAWDVLLTHGLVAGTTRVLACMQRVLARARGDEAWRPVLLQMRANLTRHDDPPAALHDLFAAFLHNGDRAFLQRQVELGGAAFTAAAIAAALARLPDADAERVRTALAADPGVAGVHATLRGHLERMIALCRAHGAEVWLLSYPEPDAARDELLAQVAAAGGARFLALHPRFSELLREVPRATLFIADGHCTDRGYGEMAAVIAAALR